MNRYKLLALAAALTGLMGAASADTTLTVYTALEADQIKAYQAAFEAGMSRSLRHFDCSTGSS